MKKILSFIIILLLFSYYFLHKESTLIRDHHLEETSFSELEVSNDKVQSTAPTENGDSQNVFGTGDEHRSDINDYYSYALSLLDEAKKGDNLSQYLLAKTISKCGFLMESRSILEDKLSLYISVLTDETDKNYLLTVQEDIVKCSYFESSDLSVFSDEQISTWRDLVFYWNKNAALAGNVAAAAELLFTGLTVDDNTLRQQLVDQLTASLNLGSPATSFYYGAALQSEEENREEGIAWMLHACQSGFDCGYSSESNIKFIPLIQCIATDSGNAHSQNCFQHLTINKYLQYTLPKDVYLRASDVSSGIAVTRRNSEIDNIRIRRNLQALLSP